MLQWLLSFEEENPILEGWRGEREGREEGGMEGEMEGGRERWRERWREGGREKGEREGGRKGRKVVEREEGGAFDNKLTTEWISSQ